MFAKITCIDNLFDSHSGRILGGGGVEGWGKRVAVNVQRKVFKDLVGYS